MEYWGKAIQRNMRVQRVYQERIPQEYLPWSWSIRPASRTQTLIWVICAGMAMWAFALLI